MKDRSRTSRIACLIASAVLLAIAVPVPGAALAGDYAFSVRMAQHLLLQLVIPPLFFLGLAGRVKPDEWEGVCRLMEAHYRAGRFEAGSIAGVDAIGVLLARHFPSSMKRARDAPNELPDRPTLL